MKLNKSALIALTVGITFTSCSNDDNAIIPVVPLGDYENGIIISHEGNFLGGNASVSFISNDFSTIENGIYSNVNNDEPLGDVAQSIAFNGNFAYIIVNNSDKIEVVNRFTFESITTITGFDNPRYMAISNGKGYVTAWGDFSDTTDDSVVVIDLTNNTVIDTITVGHLPDQIIANSTNVYVGVGIFDFNNQLTIINSITDTVETTLTVGDNPNSLEFDTAGDLWVLSSGNSSFSGNETPGSLVKVNTTTNVIEATLDFAAGEHPNHLELENSSAYYLLSGSVFKMNQTDTSLPTTQQFGGLNFADMSVNNGFLYGVDALDFASPGVLQVFDLSTNTETQSITIGIIPGEVYFN